MTRSGDVVAGAQPTEPVRARAIPIFDIETEFDGLGAHELTAMLGGKAAGLVRMRRDLGFPCRVASSSGRN
ncbi:MAG: hypothetical protein R3E48_21275 [Burkholderiaceae bacterium]